METRVFLLKQGPGLFAAFEPLTKTRESVALQATGIREMTTIKDILTEVIPELGDSSILVDERSGALIVTHVPYYLQRVEELLAELDVAPTQVLIEARFVEVTLTDTRELGIDHSLNADASLTKKGAGDGTQGPGLQLSTLGSSLLRGTKIDFTDFTNQASGLNLTLQGILSGTQYQAVLHALAEDKKTKTLSAPRVTTLNNQTATIKVVTEFVYATRYEASVVREDLNGDGDFNDSVSGKKETRFVNVPQDFVTKDLGILLHVTPSVGQDLRTITLALKPEVSEKKTEDTFGGEVVLPRFSARNLETTVVIENGETVVLGGLMKDTTSKTTTKVPVLGSLPLLGRFFRKDDDSTERSNLLIFVSAQVVNPAGAHLAFESPTGS
jgi:general secretion pathway protein D